jgi:hypothetical protein
MFSSVLHDLSNENGAFEQYPDISPSDERAAAHLVRDPCFVALSDNVYIIRQKTKTGQLYRVSKKSAAEAIHILTKKAKWTYADVKRVTSIRFITPTSCFPCPLFGAKMFCYHQLAVRNTLGLESLGRPPPDIISAQNRRGRPRDVKKSEFTSDRQRRLIAIRTPKKRKYPPAFSGVKGDDWIFNDFPSLTPEVCDDSDDNTEVIDGSKTSNISLLLREAGLSIVRDECDGLKEWVRLYLKITKSGHLINGCSDEDDDVTRFRGGTTSVREALSSKPYDLGILKSWLKETEGTNKGTNKPSVVLTEVSGLAEEHPLYTKGYWMSNDDMVFVACALLGEVNSDGMMYPTSYDLLAATIRISVERSDRANTERERRALNRHKLWNKWKAQIINCGSSRTTGNHWILSMVKYSAEPVVLLWDPLNFDSVNKEIVPYLKKEIPAADISPVVLTGQQTDHWSCGYISCFWFLIAHKLALSGRGSAFVKPDAPPAGWSKLIWSLLQVKDLQRKHGVDPMDIGAHEWLCQGWNDGTLRLPTLMEHLRTYAIELIKRPR